MRQLIVHSFAILTGVGVFFAVVPTCKDNNIVWFAYLGASLSAIFFEMLIWSAILRANKYSE